MKTVKNLELHTEYLRTRYLYLWKGAWREISLSEPTDHLDDFMGSFGHSHWTFISAENPQSQKQTEQTNQQRTNALRAELAMKRVCYVPALGRPHPDSKWQAESNFLCFDLADPLELAEKFDQRAILVGNRSQIAELKYTTDK